MRIVSVQTTSSRGGGEYGNVQLLDALAERGADVELMTNLPDLVAGTGVRATHVDLGPKLSRRTAFTVALGFPLWFARFVGALSASAKRHGPIDVLLLHYKKEQLMGALLSRRRSGAIVWIEWGPLPSQFQRGPLRWLYAAAACRTDAILAVSEATRASLLAAGVDAARTAVIPPIIDASVSPDSRRARRSAWGASDDTFVVGCLSRFHRLKRIDVVIAATAPLRGDVLLVLAGAGPEENALRARAAAGGVRLVVEPAAGMAAAEILSACDVQVYAPGPSEGTSRAVALGQVIGLPVIATAPEGAVDLIAPETGAIASPSHDPSAVNVWLARYRDDPVMRKRAGRLARERALRLYDRGRVAEEVEETLRRFTGPG